MALILREFKLYGTTSLRDRPYIPALKRRGFTAQRIKAPSAAQLEEMVATARNVTASLGGYWSVDFLADKEGKLWLIDMAEGQLSYVNEADYVNLKGKEAEKYPDNAPSRSAYPCY
jgi:hypothetical protein